MNDIEDQSLRDLLAVADPGAELDAMSAAARTAILERALEQDSAGAPTPPAAGRTAGPASRRLVNRRLGLLGVGMVALASASVVGTGLLLTVHPGGSPTRVLALRAPSTSTTGLCLRLDDFAPRALAASSVAFEGTVTSASDGNVAVRPDRFFRGGPADRVDLTTAGSTVEDRTIFQPGERVLIAAAGKDVIGCGLSGQASGALRAYYDASFGG
jgi:hypothetical protein